MNPSDFSANAKAIVDWVANYRATIADRPVMARTAPGEIKAQLPASPPEQGESFDAMLRDFDTIIAPGITNWQSPHFFGFFPGAGSLASVLGDYLSSGLSVLGLSWQASPAVTELEEVVTDWMRQMVGLSGAWSGVIQDTASTSTLVALLCARERSTEYSLVRGDCRRPNGRSSCTSRHTPTVPWTRRRCSPDSVATTFAWCRTTRRMPCAPTLCVT